MLVRASRLGRTATVGSLMAILGVTATACSGSFEPPEAFCGKSVGDLHHGLFSGEEEAGEVLQYVGKETLRRCRISEGGKRTVIAGIYLIESASELDTALTAFAVDRELPLDQPEEITVEGAHTFRVWPHLAYGLMECTNDHTRSMVVAIGARYPADAQESERVLAELMPEYARAMAEEWQGPCFDDVPDI